MNDTTSYADKLPPSLNDVLKKFAGNECVMVRYVKGKDKPKAKAGNCHINVKACIDKFGGKSISGWILNRDTARSERGMYVWSFHSVWEMPDGKWVDVTEDKHYVGRDKSIFVPDAYRLPDLVEGISFNNFIVFTEPKFAAHYGNHLGVELITNKVYWTDRVMLRVLDTEQHDGAYRLIGPEYPSNLQAMCEEYELDIVNGKPVPKPGSKYESRGAFPMKMLFDYSVSSRS